MLDFFLVVAVSILIYGCTTKHTEKRLHKNAVYCLEHILEDILEKTAVVQLPTSHLINYPIKTNNTCKTNS